MNNGYANFFLGVVLGIVGGCFVMQNFVYGLRDVPTPPVRPKECTPSQPRIGPVSRWLYPANAACYRCDTTFNIVAPRKVPFNERRQGCYALCRHCWDETTVEERIKYWEQAHRRFCSEEEWKIIVDHICKEK